MAVGLCLFALSLAVMAFGGVIFCCTLDHPVKGFWAPERIFYGLLPLCASVAMLVMAWRFWSRAFLRRRNAWLVGIPAVLLAATMDLSLFGIARLKRETDAGINRSWNAGTSTFDWGRGEVSLPPGYSHESRTGIDTIVGRFISADGRIVIKYDIGELAGEHAGIGANETLVGGSRVKRGEGTTEDEAGRKSYFSNVSFPDNGCANFYIVSSNKEDVAVIQSLATTFRPAGITPAWLRPLLPEIVRSDCRMRSRFSGGL